MASMFKKLQSITKKDDKGEHQPVAATETPSATPPSHDDGKAKESKLEAMIFSAMATATKKIKARGLVGEVKVSGTVFGLTLHISVAVERVVGEEASVDHAAIGDAEEQSTFKRKLEEAVDKMLVSTEGLARRMRARGLRGSVGGALEFSLFATGIAIEIDIALESFEFLFTTAAHDTTAATTGAVATTSATTATPSP